MSDNPIDVRVADGTDAIYAQTAGIQQDGSSGVAVHGAAFDAGTGVLGEAAGSDGVRGFSGSSEHAGVSAVNDSGGFGVWARGTPAGHFESPSGDGLQGSTGSSAYSGVFGSNWGAVEPPAGSPGGSGVFGVSVVPSASGVFGAHNAAGKGVAGYSRDGIGVWGGGLVAGHFDGNVEVVGSVSVTDDLVLVNADCAEEFPCRATRVRGRCSCSETTDACDCRTGPTTRAWRGSFAARATSGQDSCWAAASERRRAVASP
jgi:hypothetical protein